MRQFYAPGARIRARCPFRETWWLIAIVKRPDNLSYAAGTLRCRTSDAK